MFGGQLVQITELQAAHKAGVDTHRIVSGIAQVFTAVAFADNAGFFNKLRDTVRAIPGTVFTAYAFFAIVLDGPVISEMQGAGGTALNAFGFLTMVAGAGIMVYSGSGIGTGFVAFDSAE